MQDKCHIEHLKQVLRTSEIKAATPAKLEEEFCSFHNLLQSSLNQVSQICMYLPNIFVRICIPLIFISWFYFTIFSSLDFKSCSFLIFTDDDILYSVHRFRPKFLSLSTGLPSYHDPYKFKHTCVLECQPNAHTDVAAKEEGDPSSETKKCVSVPYVALHQFQAKDVAEKFAAIIKEVMPFQSVVISLY